MKMNKKESFEYPVIDNKKTGEWLRILCRHYGYSVKDIQEYLHISSNQAIYEWFNGHTLPSVNNLLALSSLFGIPMNQLLVDNVHNVIYREKDEYMLTSMKNRCMKYYVYFTNENIIKLEKQGA